MHTLTFKADEELNLRLEKLAEKLERNKSHLIRKALEQYLEDTEDYLLALEAMQKDKPGTRIPLDVIERRYGLDG